MAITTRWHLDQLDAGRGIAILGVIVVHAGLGLPLHRFTDYTFTGQRGVQLFFIISAFTLFMSQENRKSEYNPQTNFLLRRLFRLVPLYYIATLVTALYVRPALGTTNDIILALLFLHGFTVHSINHGTLGAWTLANEAMFYACLPFLFRKIRNFRDALLWLGCTVLLVLPLCFGLVHVFKTYHDFLLFVWFPVEFPVFLTGIVLFFLWKEHLRERKDVTGRENFSALALMFMLVVYYGSIPLRYESLYLSTLPCAFLVIAILLYPWKLLCNKTLVFLGKISYSIYLLHFFVIIFLDRSLHADKLVPWQHFIARLAGILILTIPLAYLSWRFIEVPGIQLGSRLIKRNEARSAAHYQRNNYA